MGIIIPIMGIYADALFTKTQQRVLATLFGQPDRSFYANEIIALADVGSGSVQRELAKLAAAGLVTVKPIGNQKHYQANYDTPIFAELRGIVLKTFGVADVLRNVLQPLWPQIDLAFVFGSLAKGTEHAGSDVDLMVVGTVASHAALLEALIPAREKLGREVNTTFYTPNELVQRIREGRSFMARVLAQPKIFVKGSEHDLTQYGGPGGPGRFTSAGIS
ncbi:MAG TPA: nucleotidyltransferase domain-containing protein [Eoetvoesiella sp.]